MVSNKLDVTRVHTKGIVSNCTYLFVFYLNNIGIYLKGLKDTYWNISENKDIIERIMLTKNNSLPISGISNPL